VGALAGRHLRRPQRILQPRPAPRPAPAPPELDDNLEARLILLQRRLADRAAPLAIEKTGRGRFRLVLARPVELVEEAEAA